MVKYFEHRRSANWINCPFPNETADKINKYAEENGLDVVSLSCDGDNGIFVTFKKKE